MTKLLIFSILIMHCATAHADDKKVEPSISSDDAIMTTIETGNYTPTTILPDHEKQTPKYDSTTTHGNGIISISTHDPHDTNWKGMLEIHGLDAIGLTPVVLPVLSYPIENLEIKLKLLDKKF